MATDEVVLVGTHATEIQVVGRADGAVRPIAVPDGVTKGVFYRVVAAYDAQFRATGKIPELADVKRLLPTTNSKAVSAVLKTEEFAEALKLRGISFIPADGLSPQQSAVLNILENFSDGRSITAKLKDAGVSRTQFNGWLKDPLFYKLYDDRVESHLRTAHLPALSTIMAAAENGDVKAAERILEINGRYNPQNAELQNARVVVSAIVDAIQKHVPDPEVQRKIFDEVNMARQVAKLTA